MNIYKSELISGNFMKDKEAEVVLKQKTKRLKMEQENEGPHNAMLIKQLQGELGLLLEQEDIKWR